MYEKGKKSLCLVTFAIVLFITPLNAFAADSELTFDEFFTALQNEYAKYNIHMYVTPKDKTIIFTQELLNEELAKIPQIAKAYNETDIAFSIGSDKKSGNNYDLSPRIMPVDRTVSLYGKATNILLAGAFCEIKLDVYTTVDVSTDKFIAVNGHSSYKSGYAVNYKGYSETGFSWSYANAKKTLNLTWSGNVTFATTVAGQEVSYDTQKTWSGSVNV